MIEISLGKVTIILHITDLDFKPCDKPDLTNKR